MKVKVRKKPVREAERAEKVRLKVTYTGVKINGRYHTFGRIEDLWKYVGSTVIVSDKKVFDLNGNFLGDINHPVQEDCNLHSGCQKIYLFDHPYTDQIRKVFLCAHLVK